MRFAFNNKLSLWLSPLKKNEQNKKRSRGKQTRKKKGRKNYDDLSTPGLPDFVSGLVPNLHGIPYYSNTERLRFEAVFR